MFSGTPQQPASAHKPSQKPMGQLHLHFWALVALHRLPERDLSSGMTLDIDSLPPTRDIVNIQGLNLTVAMDSREVPVWV